MLTEPTPDKGVSTIYRKLVNNSPDMLGALRDSRTVDLGNIDDEDWVEAIQSPREIAICARFRLFQLGILHSSYYSRTLTHER